MTAAITGTLTGSLALAGVVIGAILGRQNSDREWTRDAQLRACQRLLGEYAHVRDALCNAGMGKPEPVSWIAWNHALDEVTLLCPPAVVERAQALGEEIWRADWATRHGSRGTESWLDIRRSVDQARADLIVTMRQQLNPRHRERVRTNSRPSDVDAMWLDGGAGLPNPLR